MKKINLYMDEDLWHAFRVACLQRKTSPSREIQAFVQIQLKQWTHEEKTR